MQQGAGGMGSGPGPNPNLSPATSQVGYSQQQAGFPPRPMGQQAPHSQPSESSRFGLLCSEFGI